MEVNIRLVKESDNVALADIIRSCFDDFQVSSCHRNGTVYTDPTTDHLYQLFQKERSTLFVAEDSNGLLGCCGIYPTENLPENYGELVKFYLSSNARGKGVGKKLLSQTLEEAKRLGYKKIYLESIPEFSKAVSIYEKQGFTYLDEPLGNSGHTGCNLWMVKNIISS